MPVKHDVTSRTANGRRGALSIPKSTIAVTAEELNRLTELRVSPQHSADFFPPAPVLERMVDAALRRIRAQDAESARRLAEFEPGTLAIDSEFELADVFACAIRTAWHGRRALVAIAAGHFDANVLADAVAACEAHGQMQLVAHQDAIAREPSGRKSHDARALEKFKEIEANAAGRATVGELETMTANALRAEGISIAARTVRKARERAGLTARKSNQN